MTDKPPAFPTGPESDGGKPQDMPPYSPPAEAPAADVPESTDPDAAETTARAIEPATPQEVAEAHRQLIGDSSIQFELPIHTPEPPPPPPDWLVWLAEFFQSEHPLLRMGAYLIAALLAALLLWLIVRAIARSDFWRRRKGAAEADEADWRPDQAPARALLAEADALAGRGLFAEAVHLLLFRSLEDLDTRRPGLLRPALTSRDIAKLPAIPDSPRSAFARIAQRVERGLFARRPITEPDWRDCRAAYEEFAFAAAWRTS